MLVADLEIPEEVSDEVQSEILGDPAEDEQAGASAGVPR